MLAISNTVRVYILHSPISFHKQINGLVAAAKQLIGKDPVNGAYFIFCSKSRHSIRVLHFDGSGFWLCTKRLSRGTFTKIWPDRDGDFSLLSVPLLQNLIWSGGVNFKQSA